MRKMTVSPADGSRQDACLDSDQMTMNKIRLGRLSLRNFKGVRDFTLDAGGYDVAVYGDNAAGKTTLADAFSWLLFDKDSSGRSDFEIKTLTPAGEPLHGLEHQVEASLILAGVERHLTLRKVYSEHWTKKRGQAEKTFTGHTTDHFVDGVPVQKGEYDAAVAELASEDAFRSLTDPAHFAERIHWKERRQALLDVCGDVTDEDVIASDAALADLPGILAGRSMEDHRKVIAAKRTEINQELGKIPVRIDQETRALRDVADLDGDRLRARLVELRESRNTAEQDRARIEAGGEAAEKTKQLRQIEAELQTISTRTTADAEAHMTTLRAERSRLQGEVDEADRAAGLCDTDIREAGAQIEPLEKLIAEQQTLRRKLDSASFEADWNEPGACAACGQELPADRVEAARAKAQEEFNAAKARRLHQVNGELERLQERHDELLHGGDERGKALEAAEEIAGLLRGKLDAASRSLDDVECPNPADDPEYQKAATSKQRLEAEIATLSDSNTEALEAASGRVAAIDEQIAEVEGKAARVEQHREATARIEGLQRDERRLANEYEELERQLYLTEEFVRRKVSLLTDRINSRFELARFQLFRQLVNGGLEECCEVSFDGVPYRDLNHGARINVGIDIINTLAVHHGFAPPVFVDSAESIVDIRRSLGQMVRLVVSGDDRQLRVEVRQPATTGAAA